MRERSKGYIGQIVDGKKLATIATEVAAKDKARASQVALAKAQLFGNL